MQAISDFIYDSGSGLINITIDTNIYALETIHVATYQYTERYHILITPNTDHSVTVIFDEKDKGKSEDVIKDLKDFTNSLIDYQVRRQLHKTNGKIRDLIVAHAFSPLDIKKETKAL